MAKYKTVKRKAEVGERILITDAISPFGTYCNGDVFTVSIKFTNGVRVHEHDTFIFHEEYEVITENETEADGQMRSMKTRYDLALEKALEAIQELHLVAYEQGYKDATAKAPIGRELTRDEIIEKAKRDVADLANDDYFQYTFRYKGYSGHDLLGGTRAKVDYVVNREKRTIVASIKSYYGNGKLLAKGIAKCAPDDCFNVHIGKAIALRRALGLEVPAEYLNAPQPTEVRIGDVVEYNRHSAKVMPDDRFSLPHGECAESSKMARDGKVIDDSRDGDCE